VDNLANILLARVLWSDAKCLERGLDCEIVGLPKIKERRLSLNVSCYQDTTVGQYVPFYFCPRSIMLYILHKGNHENITYKGGQQPIIHLQSDLKEVVSWADLHGFRWAFSDRNASARIAQFFNSLNDLDQIDWSAVAETDFTNIKIKEGKQAEFLVYESFPWKLVEKIGVLDRNIELQVHNAISDATYKPIVSIVPSWYY
jgi:hypothetical protein